MSLTGIGHVQITATIPFYRMRLLSNGVYHRIYSQGPEQRCNFYHGDNLNPLENLMVGCPYCGTSIELEVDTTSGNQAYIEDCHICCSPINFSISISADGIAQVDARTDDE